MIETIRKNGIPWMAGLALLATACTQSGEESPLVPSQSQPGATAPRNLAPETTPVPVASLTLANGNTVEFYDFKKHAMIMEVGKAGTQPTIVQENPAEGRVYGAEAGRRMVDTWKALAPERAVPKALLDIEARWKNLPSRPQPGLQTEMSKEILGDHFGLPASRASEPLAKAATPQGCNNGCCDYDWLITLYQCKPDSWDRSWFHYNSGYSWARYNDVAYYSGLVCAANGTSKWSLTLENEGGGTWSIIAGHYRTYTFLSDDWDDPDVRSYVNSEASQKLHTHCGLLLF